MVLTTRDLLISLLSFSHLGVPDFMKFMLMDFGFDAGAGRSVQFLTRSIRHAAGVSPSLILIFVRLARLCQCLRAGRRGSTVEDHVEGWPSLVCQLVDTARALLQTAFLLRFVCRVRLH